MTDQTVCTTSGFDPRADDPDSRREPCDNCDHGWVEGDPTPTPQGPHYPSYACTRCDGSGWVEIEYEPLEEDDLFEGGE